MRNENERENKEESDKRSEREVSLRNKKRKVKGKSS